MHGAIITEYIRKRMAELGHGDNYTLRLRHFIVGPEERIQLSIDDQLLVLLEPVELVQISSNAGIYDLSPIDANELQYEHSGTVVIRNKQSDRPVHVRFIQAIPN